MKAAAEQLEGTWRCGGGLEVLPVQYQGIRKVEVHSTKLVKGIWLVLAEGPVGGSSSGM
eukprot:CAMPEP_0171702534 /NCGR_PEP_ID=MMETSP0991-20121206/11643_1 /TAXON_ID=483369 /ORGANISM="non described non described, Strain CCMP2098" /LENGTH=58 /DNA_ID=CAMNT_0012291875 /DNA_START=827 /DNA_END=1003 /DNA_ORIENTATION=-